ncbi:hypothetical protein D1872_277590 [compost metagenome]
MHLGEKSTIFLICGKIGPYIIHIGCSGVDGENLNIVSSIEIIVIELPMLLEIRLLQIMLQTAEHTPVLHSVSVDDRIPILSTYTVAVIHENTSRSCRLLLVIAVQIVGIVLRLHDRIVNGCPLYSHPADNILVHL